MSATMAIRVVRLASGLVLMAFVFTHLATLAAGLMSLDAINAAAGMLMAPWMTGVGTALLAGSAIAHLALGLATIATKRTLAMRRGDAVQCVLGLAVLPLLTPHILTVRVANAYAPDLEVDFARLLTFYWHFAPVYAIQQLVVVLVVWSHASIGLHGWISVQRWGERAGRIVTPLLFATPILALLGFVEAGKQVLAALRDDPAFAADVETHWARLQSAQPSLRAIASTVSLTYWSVVVLVVAALAVGLLLRRRSPVHIRYDGGLEGVGLRGLSILEISRRSGVPHASVCSGRGRCGTCRVRVLRGAQALTPMQDVERRTLGPACAADSVRLACRARVYDDGVAVERLLAPDADAAMARRLKEGEMPAPATEAAPAPATEAAA